MGYRNRTITLDFDDLGDGCQVVMRNPKLMPIDELQPSFDVEMGDDGNPVDREKASAAGAEVMGRLIVSWVVWDVTDETDDPKVLPLPAEDPTVLDRVPMEILKRLGDELAAATRPR